MISVRLLPFEEIETKLKSVGCEPTGAPPEADGGLKTAQWWVTPWGHYFTVPFTMPDIDDDTYGFGAIWREIEKTKPADWRG